MHRTDPSHGIAYRESRGGSYYHGTGFLSAPGRSYDFPDSMGTYLGFRLVMITPEPGTGLLVIAGLVGLSGWRRVRA